MSLSVPTANKILDFLVNGQNATADAARWMSLHTAAPGATGANEVTDSGYGRVEITGSFAPASGGAVTNDVLVAFGVAVTGFTASHYGIWDAATGGNFRQGDPVNPNKVVGAGESIQFAVGEIDIVAA